MIEPTTYYSTSLGNWSLINQGLPCCKPGTLAEAERCAAFYKLTPAPLYWDGDIGRVALFASRETDPAALNYCRQNCTPADPHQAAEAAAFGLTHTPNQPRSTSAQNPLF
jgi:hypothetical protein